MPGEHARSINLANAVSIAAYECYRRRLHRRVRVLQATIKNMTAKMKSVPPRLRNSAREPSLTFIGVLIYYCPHKPQKPRGEAKTNKGRQI